MGNIKMTDSKGLVQIYDGDKIYSSASVADGKGVRFKMFTWPYFFALPYKLTDPGANVEPLGKKPFADKYLASYKLTFDQGVGDSPDDWYVIYLNEDGTIHAAGYIVTFGGKEKSEAEKSPHVIVYENYKMIEGMPIATSWKFYNWADISGITGEAIGSATLSDFSFPVLEGGFYKAGEGFVVVE
jgi:hypothetical protein